MSAKNIRAALDNLREKRDSCGLHSLVFVPYMHKLTPEQRDQAEANIRYHFCLWWDTWIASQINAIESALPSRLTRPASTRPAKGGRE